MKTEDKRKLLEEFRTLRKSIKNKFSEAEIVDEIKKAKKLKHIINKSKLKQKDAEDISNKINEGIAGRFKDM